MNNKVSIVLPVYNAEKYLERCLDSVCNQTLKDIEIICVNDASTDNSLEILNDYAKKYSNIKVIDCITNGGESKARNIGLDNATGEYIAFVDNDDEIDLDFYEKLYSKAQETGADIVKGNVHIFNYNGKESFDKQNKMIRENNSKFFFAWNWWAAIYKHKLIKDNNIRLLEGYPLGGDVLFLNQTLILSNKLELIDNVFYNYYRREDSGDSKILSLEKIKSVLNIHEKIIENSNQNLYKIDKTGILYIYEWCISSGMNLLNRRKTLESLEFCVNKIFDMYKQCFYHQELNEKLKIKYLIEVEYLQKGDKLGLLEYFKKYDTLQKRFFALARYKQRRGANV